MKTQLSIILLAIIIVSCNFNSGEDVSGTQKVKQRGQYIEESEQDTSSINTVIIDSIPLISGSCANDRPSGDGPVYQYRHKRIIGTSKTDSIRVKSDATCFQIKDCDHNVLGRIKSGTVVFTTDGLKNNGGSAGIAYAFLVRDVNGDTCRAYLSYLNFE